MHFDLWDTETSNYYGRFEDEREALQLVRRLVNRFGESYAQDLGLGRVNDEGEILEPLSGDVLLARIKEVLRDPQEERRGVLIASSIQTRKTIRSSIEPMAAAASRRIRRFADAGQRRMQRD
ncbi:MAG: hypothetical protein ACRDJC_16030 [Thermomicrobiales bacterium]